MAKTPDWKRVKAAMDRLMGRSATVEVKGEAERAQLTDVATGAQLPAAPLEGLKDFRWD
jgi:hypothetical protein